jgi:hypothetical protein
VVVADGPSAGPVEVTVTTSVSPVAVAVAVTVDESRLASKAEVFTAARARARMVERCMFACVMCVKVVQQGWWLLRRISRRTM